MCSSLRSETSLYTARIPCCIKMHGILRIVLHACMLALIMCIHCSFALNLTAIQSRQYPTCNNMITGRFLHKYMYCCLCILCVYYFFLLHTIQIQRRVCWSQKYLWGLSGSQPDCRELVKLRPAEKEVRMYNCVQYICTIVHVCVCSFVNAYM